MVRDVYIHGAASLHLRLDVKSPREAISAVLVLRPAFREVIRSANWMIVVGDLEQGYVCDVNELMMNAGHQPIHFLPEALVSGGLARSIGKIVIGVTLIAVSIWFPPAAGGAYFTLGSVGITASTVMGLGLSMVLGGVAGLISPTPRMPRSTDRASPDERPSFFFNGPVNVSEQGAPIPLIYGYFRAGTIIISGGLVNEDLPAEETDAGTDQETDAEYPTKGDEYVAKGGGKGGGGFYSPNEAPNTLRSRSIAKLHEILCEGPIKGPRVATVDEWPKAVFLDNTPMMAADGTLNFRVVAAHLRSGLPQETPMPGFATSESTVNVGVQVKEADGPVVRRLLGANTSAVRVNIRTPRLLKSEDNGDINPYEVEYKIEYQHGTDPWVLVVQDKMEGKTVTGYERSISFSLPPRDGRTVDVRVTRVSADETEVKRQNETWWSSLIEIVNGVFRYDDLAASAFVVDAEQFPAIPKRSFEFDWLIVSTPSNYNPVTRVYTGDWDGTFIEQWTDNPAWVLYDLLTHPRRGLGRDITADKVDKWSFYAAAQFNDELVSDGMGGMTPRYTFNGMLNAQEEAYNIIMAVASTMRAQVYAGGGTIILAQDRPLVGTPRVINQTNVKDASFDYSSTEHKSRATVSLVQWVDPSQNWLVQVEPVPYPDMMGRFGYRDLPLLAVGCTNRSQAIRLGRHFVFSAHHEQEIVSFVVSIENADLRPGDIIAIHDPSRAAVRYGGRVMAVAGQTVTLDTDIEGTPAGEIWFAEGATVKAATIASWPAANQVTVTGDITGITAASVWAIQTTQVNLTLWRILLASEQENLEFKITATYHDPAKWAFVEQNLLLPEQSYTAFPQGALLAPTNLVAQDYYSLDPTGAPQAGLLFSWTPAADARVIHYVITAVGPGKVVTTWPTLVGTSVVLAQAETGEWKFTIRSADGLGRTSTPTELVVNTVTMARTPLPPERFSGRLMGSLVYLSWDPPADLSISHFWLKFTPDVSTPTWESASTVQFFVPRNLQSLVAAGRTGTYLFKSVSVRGVESSTAAMLTVQALLEWPLAEAEHAEETLWSGTASDNVTVVSGELVMTAPTSLTPDLDIVFTTPRSTVNPMLKSGSYITPSITVDYRTELLAAIFLSARGVVDADIMANWQPLSSAVPLARAASGSWEVLVEERYRLDNDVDWSEWRRAGESVIPSDEVQFRVLMAVYDIGVSIKCASMHEALQLVPYEERGTDVTDTIGESTVTFESGFFLTPMVSTQLAPSESGKTLVVDSVSSTGFSLKSFVTPGTTLAAGVDYDWVASSYGRRL